MKPKCPFYMNKLCGSTNKCPFQIWYHEQKQCRKGGLLKTPTKLKHLEEVYIP